MPFEPSLEEQELLAGTFERPQDRMSRRERAAELLVAGAFFTAVAAIWVARPPGSFSLAPALICVVLMALAMSARLDTPLGFTVPTQLVFVPLVFSVPVALAPLAVLLALTLARLPEVLTGKLRASRLLALVGNSSFALGPAAAFAIADTPPARAGVLLLLIALAAQFTVDFAVSSFRFVADRGAAFSLQLSDAWVYGVDAALSPVGLIAAGGVHSRVLAILALLPLLGLLALFAQERHQRFRHLLELNNAYRGTALVLGDVVEADDLYTGEHSKGVVALALSVAEAMGLSAEQRRNVEFAALLHDVGKIAIPKEIINKPGRLDPDEWMIIKTHTVEGQKMLDRVGGFMGEVGQIVRSHHERWDGTGYPDRMRGEAIPLEARIIACCDTWNAMRTDRTYRPALSHERALRELSSVAGTQLDPRIVEILESIVVPPRGGGAASAADSLPERSVAPAVEAPEGAPAAALR